MQVDEPASHVPLQQSLAAVHAPPVETQQIVPNSPPPAHSRPGQQGLK